MWLLLLSLLWTEPQAPGAPETVKYADNGISFEYPKDWKLSRQKQGAVTMLIMQNDKGTGVIIQLLPGAVETTFPRGENWGWKVLKKEVKKGEEVGPLCGTHWSQPIVFVFK
jgi:hypothetical protein